MSASSECATSAGERLGNFVLEIINPFKATLSQLTNDIQEVSARRREKVKQENERERERGKEREREERRDERAFCICFLQ